MIQIFRRVSLRSAVVVCLWSLAPASLFVAPALAVADGLYATYPGVFTIDMQAPAQTVDLGVMGKGFESKSGDLAFVAFFSDVGYGPGGDMQAVEHVRSGMLRQGGRITEVNTLPNVGDAAEEFTLTTSNGTTFRNRVIKIGPRLFVLQVVDPRGRTLPIIWDLFFGSFRTL